MAHALKGGWFENQRFPVELFNHIAIHRGNQRLIAAMGAGDWADQDGNITVTRLAMP